MVAMGSEPIDKAALEEKYYNATITGFEYVTDGLWKIRVRPDNGVQKHKAGQYLVLGLGYWQDRDDNLIESDIDKRINRIVKRAYSISTPFLDSDNQLVDTNELDDYEFYISRVHSDTNIASLTPRLAKCEVGSRIFCAKRPTGKYTLNPVTDPDSTCVFISTGTGEAPHISMASELLRNGHSGQIISVVTARLWTEFAYDKPNKKVEELFSNYHYLPLPTREADVAKRYPQDVLADTTLETLLGVDLTPETSHIFLCGNPKMIGMELLPDIWPRPVGMCELFTRRGFTVNTREQKGNIYLEEYWG